MQVHFACMGDEDRTVIDGIPVTALPRTLLDIAATMPSRLERSIERANELRAFDLRAVDALLERADGQCGTGRLRGALAIYREQPGFTRSRLERHFLELVKAAGLGAPVTGHNVVGYELDAYWPLERFAVELDVYETHGSRAAFERDRLRQEELKLVGVEMIRVTGSRLDREPREVIRRVTTLLGQRRRQLSAELDAKRTASSGPAGG
jgi:very-short-patch-repair endonuclease